MAVADGDTDEELVLVNDAVAVDEPVKLEDMEPVALKDDVEDPELLAIGEGVGVEELVLVPDAVALDVAVADAEADADADDVAVAELELVALGEEDALIVPGVAQRTWPPVVVCA